MPKLVRVATPARAVWASAAGLAFASLPRWARRLYRSPGLPTTDLGASVTLRGLRAASVVLPASIRHPPAYRAAQKRLAETPIRRLSAV